MEGEMRSSYRKPDEDSAPEEGAAEAPKPKGPKPSKADSVGFVVPAAPWDQPTPDTNSTTDFPSFGPLPGASAPVASWGPRR